MRTEKFKFRIKRQFDDADGAHKNLFRRYRDTSYTFFHTHKGKVHSARSFSAPMVALLKGAEERASNAPWQRRGS